MQALFIFLFLALHTSAFATEESDLSLGHFSARISRVNEKAKLLRIRADFLNSKYLNKLDRVYFYSEYNPKTKCLGHIIGKSNLYMLLRVPEMQDCVVKVNLVVGGYIRIQSEDLLNNIKLGEEVVALLLKKRLAIGHKKESKQKELETFVEKVEAVNQRYRILSGKLEMEREREIANLEEDKANAIRNYKSLEILLNEIDHKLEQYRVNDNNFKVDRWALDKKLYIQK